MTAEASGRGDEVRRRDFIGAVVMGLAGGAPGIAGAVPPPPGKAAPEFSVTLLDGQRVSLKDFRGKPVLLNFWSSG